MTTGDDIYIALLRGINVGGHGRLPMEEFRQILGTCGARDPKTYIQSGNAVFRGEVSGRSLADAIETAKGFRPGVVVLSAQQLRQAIDANPYSDAIEAPKTLHFYFLSQATNIDADAINAIAAPDERWHLGGKVFYLHTPSGFGVSKLAARIERLLGVAVTARNWNTVAKLYEMAGLT